MVVACAGAVLRPSGLVLALHLARPPRWWPLPSDRVARLRPCDTPCCVSTLGCLVGRRYLMFDPSHREDYVDYLEGEGQWEQAAKQLAICVNDDDFVSPHVSWEGVFPPPPSSSPTPRV